MLLGRICQSSDISSSCCKGWGKFVSLSASGLQRIAPDTNSSIASLKSKAWVKKSYWVAHLVSFEWNSDNTFPPWIIVFCYIICPNLSGPCGFLHIYLKLLTNLGKGLFFLYPCLSSTFQSKSSPTVISASNGSASCPQRKALTAWFMTCPKQYNHLATWLQGIPISTEQSFINHSALSLFEAMSSVKYQILSTSL